jgi:hypothetical protein
VSAIQDFIGAVLGTIRQILPSGVECRMLHCQLDLDEISREFHKAPSALVAVPRVTCDEVQGGEPLATVSMAVYLLTEGLRPTDRSVAGLELVELLLRRITRERWGADGVRRAQGVTAQVVSMTELERKAVTLWEISWTQSLELPDTTEGLVTDYEGTVLTLTPDQGEANG